MNTSHALNRRRPPAPLSTLSALPFVLLAVALCASCRGEGAGGRNANANVPATEAAAATAGGNLDAEIARLKGQAEKNPGDEETRDALSQAYTRRADAARGAGRLKEALNDYQMALRANPDNAAAQQRVAEISPQVGGEATGEYGEPAPLPITPNVTTGETGATERGSSRAAPTPKSSPTGQQPRKP